jgi:hypothetical protein
MGVKQIRLDTAFIYQTSRRLFASCAFRLSIIWNTNWIESSVISYKQMTND